MHDWVADRIAYDAPSYAVHRYPPQDADAIFAARIGVCSGYAHLFAAIAKAGNLEAAYVVGDARAKDQREHGEPHAWSAIKIEGRWYLLDVTWDSGTVEGTTFTKRYTTDYFVTPPEVFGLDHFPDDARWQLRPQVISRGDFFRQPMMSPRFYAEGRELVAPDRSQVSVHGPLEITIKNPSQLFTLATFHAASGEKQRCTVTDGVVSNIHCALPAAGSYQVLLFSNDQRYGDYHFIGQIEANLEP
jgi:transglutaminase/protease-like cytokinesis protein 3